MMNGMVNPEHHEAPCRPLKQPAKINDLHQLVAGELGQCIEVLRESLVIPCRDFLRRLYVLGNSRRLYIKKPVDGGLQETVLRGGNVPHQLVRGLRYVM